MKHHILKTHSGTDSAVFIGTCISLLFSAWFHSKETCGQVLVILIYTEWFFKLFQELLETRNRVRDNSDRGTTLVICADLNVLAKTRCSNMP